MSVQNARSRLDRIEEQLANEIICQFQYKYNRIIRTHDLIVVSFCAASQILISIFGFTHRLSEVKITPENTKNVLSSANMSWKCSIFFHIKHYVSFKNSWIFGSLIKDGTISRLLLFPINNWDYFMVSISSDFVLFHHGTRVYFCCLSSQEVSDLSSLSSFVYKCSCVCDCVCVCEDWVLSNPYIFLSPIGSLCPRTEETGCR